MKVDRMHTGYPRFSFHQVGVDFDPVTTSIGNDA